VSELCQGPRNTVSAPGFAVPKQACDCHAHIIGPEARFPFVEPRSFTPPDALVPQYRAMLATLGLDRNVVIQPSVYGTDNSRTLRAVLELGADRARGIAIIEESISLAELRELDAAGFKGARFITVSKGGVPVDHLEGVARKIAPLGWHIEMFVPTEAWPELYPKLRNLPTPVVFDHMAHLTPDRKADDPAVVAVMKLVETGRFWVKLCGYRVSLAGYPYADVAPVAQRFVKHAPERCVWGTDWPHTKVEGHMPDDGELLTLLADWVPEVEARERILVRNPEELYGFEAGDRAAGASGTEAILAAERSLYRAMVARDLPTLRALLAEDLVYIHSPGFAESRQEYLDAVAKGAYEYERVESRGVTVRMSAGTAVATGQVEMLVGESGKPKNVLQLLFTLVWVKRASRWQLAVRQATRIPGR
jgi:predicted TIM-barrel fold metal-dependent hydrolase/ketosteroid isomerase-like protein